MGVFNGRVVTEWLKDTKDHRLMRLEENFTYIDDNNIEWVARKGNLTDGASIPKYLWSIMGAPLAGKYRRAAVIHDVFCKNRSRTYGAVHAVFYEAMLADGVGKIKAKIMYWAVRNFGPKWVSILEE